MKKVSYQVPLNSLYKVVSSCMYEEDGNFCPVLTYFFIFSTTAQWSDLIKWLVWFHCAKHVTAEGLRKKAKNSSLHDIIRRNRGNDVKRVVPYPRTIQGQKILAPIIDVTCHPIPFHPFSTTTSMGLVHTYDRCTVDPSIFNISSADDEECLLKGDDSRLKKWHWQFLPWKDVIKES